ncbi:MAG: response regulator transcription factor [Aquabacterium sp.]|uniref:response regulator transcription factor n=1 Tax=Aquabacterium sp. TaxID=1872578 RepID=UPI001DB061BC|nr:response regulator transcription factor [Aquabacterium sp.]MBT9609287.1 response regulator transcription factor [Aquabacterium sp.]
MSLTGPRFLLVDDHALFRMGLSLMLTERWPHAMLTQAGTWAQALAHLQAQAADLVLLDIHLPDGHGLDDLAVLRELAPQARVLLMSSDADPAHIAQARDAGIDGFVPKSAQAADIVAAVQAILRGEQAYAALPYAALGGLGGMGSVTSEGLAPGGVLQVQEAGVAFSDLQLALLRYLGKGTPNKAIARQMGMSESAVRAEVSWITEWLQATSRREAYERAVARGLIAP